MKSVRLLHYVIFLSLTWLSVLELNAQSTVSAIGVPIGTSTFPIEHGVINLNNGNVHLEIPIESYTQRGDLQASAKLVYDSGIWEDKNPCGIECFNWEPYAAGYYGGWQLQYMNPAEYSFSSGQGTYAVPCENEDGKYVEVYAGWGYVDSSGTEHVMPAVTVQLPSGCIPIDGNTYVDTPSATAYATDGSGYYVTVSNYDTSDIYDSKGTHLVNSNQNVPGTVDRNGNYIVSANNIGDLGGGISTGLKDTLNRTLITQTLVDDYGVLPLAEYLDVPLANGQTGRYTINFKIIDLKTNFGVPGSTEFDNDMQVISSIVLPDGSSYQFNYEEGSYGELKSMTLPHGGTVTFAYTSDSNGGDGIKPARWVSSHTGSDGTTTFNWAYQSTSAYSEEGRPCSGTTNTVTNATTQANYTFSMCNGAILPQEVTYGAVGATQPDVTVFYEYDLSHPCPTIGTNEVYHLCEGAEWRNLIAKTVVLSSTSGSSKTTETQYAYQIPGSGIPTTIKQWDYYSGSPTDLPTRETDQTLGYPVNNSVLYPTVVTHKDSTGAVVSTTNYTYDEPAYFSKSSTAPNHDDAYITGNRGNPTTISVCCAMVGGQSVSLVSHIAYDNAGSITAVYDPNGNKTTFGYDSTDTFPETITSPSTTGTSGQSVAHVTHSTFDPNSGQITSSMDQNGQTTTYGYDTAGRLSSVSFSNGSSPVTLQTITYPSVNETDVATLQSSGVTLTSSTITDSYGRPVQVNQGGVSSETTYDAQGHVYSVTNPHYASSSSTDGTTYYGYDEISRLKSLTLPNGRSSSVGFSANSATITDPLQHSRQLTSDAFGDITTVLEPSTTGALSAATAYATTYAYNWQGQATQVQQQGGSSDSTQWRTRTFAYDGAGRMTSQTTPEAGTTLFHYDLDGNLLNSQNANSTNNTTQYSYDADNRLVSMSVAGGPTYGYTYDGQDSSSDPYGIGRLTGTTNGSNVQTLVTHDALGRVVTTSYCLPSNCNFSYKVAAAYDFQDNLTSLTYPDGRKVAWTYDQLNRPMSETYASWNGASVNTPYASSLVYSAGGELQQESYGNGIQLGATYDPDQNLSSLAYLNGNTAIMQRTYTWDVNAANLKMVQDAATGRTLTYSYDQLDRLTSEADTGTTTSACVNTLPSVPASSQSYSIDAWGNLQQTGSFNFTQSYDTNNRISAAGYVYDSAGNLVQDGLGNTYQYRSDGLMASSNGATYTYDAFGQRVRKDASSSTEEIFFGGKLIAVRDAGTGTWTDRLYGPSGVLGLVAGNQTAVPAYRLFDHLGNLTNTTDGSGNVTGTTSVMPYGELATNTSGDIYPFTGHERDGENGSDVTLYRHYSSAQGRWLSPDPSNGSYDVSDPQSLNRYSYLSNRPMNNVDELGLDGDDDDDDDGDDVDFDVWISYDGYGGSSWITSYDGSDGGDYGFWWDPSGLGWLSDPTGPSNLYLGSGASRQGHDPTGPGGSALYSNNFPSSGLSAVAAQDASSGISSLLDGLKLLLTPQTKNQDVGTRVLNAWLKITSPIDKASDWTDRHPLAVVPAAVIASFDGNEGPVEEDEAIIQDKVTSAADAIENWLGEGWTSFQSETSDLALKSADGTRRIRFDLTDPHGLAPHVNIELWKMRNLYPNDQRWERILNDHIFVK